MSAVLAVVAGAGCCSRGGIGVTSLGMTSLGGLLLLLHNAGRDNSCADEACRGQGAQASREQGGIGRLVVAFVSAVTECFRQLLAVENEDDQNQDGD